MFFQKLIHIGSKLFNLQYEKDWHQIQQVISLLFAYITFFNYIVIKYLNGNYYYHDVLKQITIFIR